MKKEILTVLGLSTFLASKPVMAEALLGISYTPKGIEFQVSSGGCTSKRNFDLVVDESKAVPEITLVREFQDICTAYLPFGTKVLYSWDEIGVENAVNVVNVMATLRVPNQQ